MVDPTNRLALRRGLPWTFFGFVLLVLSVGAWVATQLARPEGEELGRTAALASQAVGLVGAGLFALGLAAYVRARRHGPGGRWLDLALVLWLAEVGLRVTDLVAPERLAGFAPALRLVLVAAAIAALSSWMRALWRDDAARRVYRTWGATRALFLLQLAGLVVLATIPGASGWLPERATLPAAWIAFALPWVAMYVALRRTMRELSRQTTVADVLAG